MRPRYALATLGLIMLSACAYGPNPALEPIASPDPLARATPGTPAQVAQAGAAVLQHLGLPIALLEPEQGRVLSGEVIVQDQWLEIPVVARLLCGAPFPRTGASGAETYDYRRVVGLTQGLPITVRLGFFAEPRLGGASTRLMVEATGHRPSVVPILPPTVPCLPTQRFTDELYATLLAALRPIGSEP